MEKSLFDLLETPVQFLKGVGPYLAGLFDKMGVKTLEDLLYLIPNRYLDRRKVYTIGEVEPGPDRVLQGELMTSGEIQLGKGRRKVFQALFTDGTGHLQGMWFHYYLSHIKKNFQKGRKAWISGKVEIYRGQKQIVHPEIEWIDEESDSEEATGLKGIVPLYPLTEGLRQKNVQKIVQAALDKVFGELKETLPEEILKRNILPPYAHALKEIHHPPPGSDIEALNERRTPIQQRLIFDEFFFLELGLALKRRGNLKESGVVLGGNGGFLERFTRSLPFELTGAQKRAVDQIRKDLLKGEPMNRLLQGDVGSGKTLVAASACLLALSAGYQACLMVPTEILAEQHFRNLLHLMGPLGISLTLLKSDLSATDRKDRLEKISRGEISMVVGTHALIQEEVQFSSLALAVVDEQHRFGVLQRAELKKKGKNPHLLVMTATPIPRTLAMTVYGDLDVSVLDELPPGRQPIVTRIGYEKNRPKLYNFMRQEVKRGRQVYIVYPLVEESEALDLKNATEMYEHLQKDIFPDLQLGLLHGQMKAETKDQLIRRFIKNEIQILVATTVIEVGVDVPNASVMVIEHAERFGLSQLHQMRGRVGRGGEKSYCFLMAAWPQSDTAKERLRIMAETNDGFKIAEADLNIRGPGDFLGTRQAGIPDFRIAHLIRDLPLLEKAREEAFAWLEKDPDLSSPESLNMKSILFHRWRGRLNLAQIG